MQIVFHALYSYFVDNLTPFFSTYVAPWEWYECVLFYLALKNFFSS